MKPKYFHIFIPTEVHGVARRILKMLGKYFNFIEELLSLFLSLKNFSFFGLAVWPAYIIEYIYMSEELYYID